MDGPDQLGPVNWKSLDPHIFWSSLDTVICDCDGVLWLGSIPIPGAAETIKFLKDKGKNVFLFSNNTGVGTREITEKCKRLGFDVNEQNILVPAKITAQYLKNIDFKKKIYLLGVEEFAKELTDAGFECIGPGPDNFNPPINNRFVHGEKIDLALDPNVGAVVAAGDFHIGYVKLLKANAYLYDPNCLFISPSPEKRYPVIIPGLNERQFLPAGGCLVDMIASMTNREPLVLGKPETVAFDLVFKPKGVRPDRAVMIGDNITDIIFGNETGMKSMLVLSGSVKTVNRRWDDKNLTPTYYTDCITDLLGSMP